jgi:plasmid maintenance system antidote protein VapI
MARSVAVNELQYALVTHIEERMKVIGWDRKTLGRHANISPAHISMMLNGKRGGSLDAWDRLLKTLTLDAGTLWLPIGQRG